MLPLTDRSQTIGFIDFVAGALIACAQARNLTDALAGKFGLQMPARLVGIGWWIIARPAASKSPGLDRAIAPVDVVSL